MFSICKSELEDWTRRRKRLDCFLLQEGEAKDYVRVTVQPITQVNTTEPIYPCTFTRTYNEDD